LSRTNASDTTALARFLIGKTLVHVMDGFASAAQSSENRGFLPGDAEPAFRARHARNRSMFGERGHAYVYTAYGVWPSMNVVGESAGIGGGVLLRALEPLEGIAEMQRRRGTEKVLDLARGPGRLATAMAVTLALDGADLCGPGPLWLGTPVREPGAIAVATRIGITKEADRPLRFFERKNPFVSGPRRLIAG
jgi:DNA-3-methyladenine glycosylase